MPTPIQETGNSVLDQAIQHGVNLCRRGDWEQGLKVLASVAEQPDRPQDLPPRFYGFLGHGLAREEKRIGQGISLCKYAVKREFMVAENYLNLARTHMLAGNLRATVRATRKGIALEPGNSELRQLQDLLGVRKRPVLPFLHRDNFINVGLGKVRHRWRQRNQR